MYLHDKGEIGSSLAAPRLCLYRLDSANTLEKTAEISLRLLPFFLLSCPPPAALLPFQPLSASSCLASPCEPGNQQETPQSISFIWQVSRIWQQQDEAAVWNLKRIKVLGENKKKPFWKLVPYREIWAWRKVIKIEHNRTISEVTRKPFFRPP